MSAVQLTGIAIFEHVRQSGKGLTFLFDAQFFPATNGPLVVLLKYFNRNGELSFTDGSRFFVEANVSASYHYLHVIIVITNIYCVLDTGNENDRQRGPSLH